MIVLAPPGQKCPMAGKPRSYITDTPPPAPEGATPERGYTVPDTVYYRRLVRDGSLIEVPAAEEPAAATHEEPAPAAAVPAKRAGKAAPEPQPEAPAEEGATS